MGKEYAPKYTIKTIKHGGGCVMVWACFSYHGVGPIHLIEGIMDSSVYVHILQNVLLPYAEYEMPLIWVMQQDNEPKHTSKLAKQWFSNQKVNIMEWPAQFPNVNPIENLWLDVKKSVGKTNPTNKNELWQAIKAAWYAIPVERCQRLVDSMPRRCQAVLKCKGYTTKY